MLEYYNGCCRERVNLIYRDLAEVQREKCNSGERVYRAGQTLGALGAHGAWLGGEGTGRGSVHAGPLALRGCSEKQSGEGVVTTLSLFFTL